MCDRTVRRMAGTPRHVVQRRTDGSPCFFTDEDYLVYLDCLKDAAERHKCAVHAYVLMPDHVQLLVSPDTEQRLSRIMRCVSGRYVEYVNYTYQRNGAFWEHGPKSTLIDSEQNVLATYLSIEATPVRECLAASPADYRWSSHGHHANGSEDAVILDHPLYLDLGATRSDRQHAYHALFRQRVGDRAPVETGPSAHLDSTLRGDRLANRIERLVERVRPGTIEHAIAAA